MTKQMPKRIFVKIMEEDNDGPYFIASEELYGLVEMGDKIKVGTYELVEVSMAEAVVKTEKVR
jgi:hypothetical protein